MGVLSELVTPSEVMFAVKTNAYGHGLIEVAGAGLKSGATALAVLEVSAGVTLRENGITAPAFAWLLGDNDDYLLASKHHIELGISTRHELEAAAHAKNLDGAQGPVVVHLKIDTGLTRNGSTEELWPDLCARAVELQRNGSVVVRGVWSHLADASPDDDADSLRRFERAIDVAREAGLNPSVTHLGASSAGLRFPESRYSYVRFGIAAYGISPFDDRNVAELNLRPVMTVTAPVLSATPEGLVVAAGYLHGILVGEHPERHVTIDGEPWHVVSINPDSMLVRRTTTHERELHSFVGATATIFGEGGPSAEQLGSWCDTIGDEVVTGVSYRLPRNHVKAEL